MKRTMFAFTLLITLILAACQPQTVAPSGNLRTEAEPAPVTGVDGFGFAGAPVEAPALGGAFYQPEAQVDQSVANQVAAADRLVIKNANLSIVVDDATASVDAITHLAESLGGYVVSLNTVQTTYGPEAKPAQQATLTIRVPSDKLNDVLNQIKGIAAEVKSESISGQDVTSEYVDLKSRLTNLEAAEKQLQSILAEAKKTEDVLAVYNQLVSTREQIEMSTAPSTGRASPTPRRSPHSRRGRTT